MQRLLKQPHALRVLSPAFQLHYSRLPFESIFNPLQLCDFFPFEEPTSAVARIHRLTKMCYRKIFVHHRCGHEITSTLEGCGMFEPCCAPLPFSLHVLVERQSHTLTVLSENRASRVPVNQGQVHRVEQVPMCDPVLPVLWHVWLAVSSGYVVLRFCNW
jgi:hypothetical protein